MKIFSGNFQLVTHAFSNQNLLSPSVNTLILIAVDLEMPEGMEMCIRQYMPKAYMTLQNMSQDSAGLHCAALAVSYIHSLLQVRYILIAK